MSWSLNFTGTKDQLCEQVAQAVNIHQSFPLEAANVILALIDTLSSSLYSTINTNGHLDQYPRVMRNFSVTLQVT